MLFMRKFIVILQSCVVCSCIMGLVSCYAFLHADRLVYAGTLAKDPSKVSVVVDSLITNYDASK